MVKLKNKPKSPIKRLIYRGVLTALVSVSTMSMHANTVKADNLTNINVEQESGEEDLGENTTDSDLNYIRNKNKECGNEIKCTFLMKNLPMR